MTCNGIGSHPSVFSNALRSYIDCTTVRVLKYSGAVARQSKHQNPGKNKEAKNPEKCEKKKKEEGSMM